RRVFQASLSVCSHVVIRRGVETGSLLGLSTAQEPWRLHQRIARPAGVPREVLPDREKAGAIQAPAYQNF
ncbi:MAG: hypothetical protein Q8M19_20325, partial [Reyranella sp.]|nr:hypothetical protein [Reyranella sp.]